MTHFAFPFSIGSDGSANTVEQGSRDEIEQGVLVLLLTTQGERIEVPEFGIQDLAFQVELDTEAIVSAAQEWDERAGIVTEETAAGMVRTVRIQVEEQ